MIRWVLVAVLWKLRLMCGCPLFGMYGNIGILVVVNCVVVRGNGGLLMEVNILVVFTIGLLLRYWL